MDKKQLIALRVCQLATFGLMAVGFGLARYWLGVWLVFALNFFNLVGQRTKWQWIPIAILFVHVGIAAGGLWLGVTPWLLIPGVIAALGCWELNDRDRALTYGLDLSAERESKQNQLSLLNVTLTISLILTGIGLYLKFQPGFGVTYAAAVIVAFSLFQLYRLIKYP